MPIAQPARELQSTQPPPACKPSPWKLGMRQPTRHGAPQRHQVFAQLPGDGEEDFRGNYCRLGQAEEREIEYLGCEARPPRQGENNVFVFVRSPNQGCFFSLPGASLPPKRPVTGSFRVFSDYRPQKNGILGFRLLPTPFSPVQGTAASPSQPSTGAGGRPQPLPRVPPPGSGGRTTAPEGTEPPGGHRGRGPPGAPSPGRGAAGRGGYSWDPSRGAP